MHASAGPSPDGLREPVAAYARRKPRGAGGVHRYSAASTGLDPAELRERFREYRERYGVAEEPS